MVRPNRERIRAIADLMASDGIASWAQCAWIVAVCAVVATFIPYGDNFVLSSLIAACSALVAFGALIAVWAVLLRRLHGTTRIMSTFACYVLTGALYAVIFQTLFVLLGEEAASSTNEIILRIVGNSTRWLVNLAIGTYVITVTRQQRRRLADLRAHQAAVELALAQARSDSAAKSEEVKQSVQRELADQLAAINDRDLPAAILDTQRIASDVVRPLSHTLAREIPQVERPDSDPEDYRISWYNFWPRVPGSQFIQPFWATVAIGTEASGTALWAFGLLDGLLAYVLVCPTWYVCLHLLRFFAPGFLRLRSFIVRLAVFVVGSILTTIPPVWILITLEGGNPGIFHLATGFMVQSLMMLWLCCLAAAIKYLSEQTDESIDRANRRLDWALARSRLVRWHQHGQIARALHGPVQSELNAALLTMREASRAGATDTAVAQEFAETLQRRIPVALSTDLRDRELTTAVNYAADLWHGMTDISMQCDEGLLTRIQSDAPAADLAISIVQDSISNAVHHGDASEIRITLDTPRPDELAIDVVDNGTSGTGSNAPGLGSAQLTDCTIRWASNQTQSGYQVHAVLPLADNLAT